MFDLSELHVTSYDNCYYLIARNNVTCMLFVCRLHQHVFRMTTKHFSSALLTLLVAVQLVTWPCLVSGSRLAMPFTGTRIARLIPRSHRSLAAKRSDGDGQIHRLWLSRGSTSAMISDRLRQLLDSDADFDLPKDDTDSVVDGSRSMRYGR